MAHADPDRLRRDRLAFAADTVAAHLPQPSGNRLVCLHQDCVAASNGQPPNWPCDSNQFAANFIADQQLAQANA